MIAPAAHAMGAIMAKRLRFISRGSASILRRRTNICILFAGNPAQAAIKRIETNAAVIETLSAPALGARVELHHPEVGILSGNVVSVVRNTVRIAFNVSDKTTRFALTALNRQIRHA
jgi:hypothetical protein